MDDRLAHFLVLLGNVCNDARTGSFAVEVVMDGGGTHIGVPDPQPAVETEEQVDDSGWSEDLRIDGAWIRLQDVSQIRVFRP